MAVTFYIPSFALSGSDTRHGDGMVLYDTLKNALVIDGFDGSAVSTKLINFLKKQELKNLNLLLSHPHYDHYKGLTMIMQDSYFNIQTFYCYDPETIRHGIGSSSNGRSVKEDYDNFYRVLNLAKERKATIKYLTTGSTVTIGDIYFKVWRRQPKSFGANDNGQGYAFINDGSLCCYFPDFQFLTTGDGPDGLKDAIAYFGGKLSFLKVPHHGNNCSQSNAAAARAAGCTLAYETNIERDGAGTTSFTSYGTRRLVQQNIKVLMSNMDITATANNKTLTVQQNGKLWSFTVPYYTGIRLGNIGTWVEIKGQGTKYKYSDGSFAKGWKEINKQWFYFDYAKNLLQKGIKKISGTVYYLNEQTGALMKNVWKQKGNKKYYFDGYGRRVSSTAYEINKKWYYFDANGVMRTGWYQDPGDKKWRYLDPVNGDMKVSQFVEVNSKIYYVDEYGRMLINQSIKVDNKWYYLNEWGEVRKGWYNPGDGYRYLHNKTGEMIVNKWLKLNDRKYYLDEYGRRVENKIIQINGQKYTFNKQGILI